MLTLDVRVVAIVASVGLFALCIAGCSGCGPNDDSPTTNKRPEGGPEPNTTSGGGGRGGDGTDLPPMRVHQIKRDAQIGTGSARHDYVTRIVKAQKAHIENGQWQDLNATYQLQEHERRDQAVYNALYAVLLLQAGGSHRERALRRALLAREVDDTFAYAHYLVALARATALRPDAPASEIEPIRATIARALDLQPAFPEALLLRAKIAGDFERDWTGARESIQAALEYDPENPEAWTLLIMILRQQSQLDEARLLLDEAHIDDTTRVKLLAELSEAYYAGRNPAAALATALAALELAQSVGEALSEAWWIQFYLLIARLHEEQSSPQRDMALAALERIFEVAIPRKAVELYEMLARRSGEAKRQRRVIELWERFIDETPLEAATKAELEQHVIDLQIMWDIDLSRTVLIAQTLDALLRQHVAKFWDLLPRLAKIDDPRDERADPETFVDDDPAAWKTIFDGLFALFKSTQPADYARAMDWVATLVAAGAFPEQRERFVTTMREQLRAPASALTNDYKVDACLKAAYLGDRALIPDILDAMETILDVEDPDAVYLWIALYTPANAALHRFAGTVPDQPFQPKSYWPKEQFVGNLREWRAHFADEFPTPRDRDE